MQHYKKLIFQNISLKIGDGKLPICLSLEYLQPGP